tara:strand:+ start:848 stop:1216 length:369 start_codon:yes stop_codon:yes gene_type:complete
MTTINIPQAPEIPEWIEKYGYVDIFSFFAYGKLSQDDVDLLIKGLMIASDFNTFDKIAIAFDYIGEDEARAVMKYRGTSIKFIFAGGYAVVEDMLTTTILDGIDYLRFKGDYVGHTRGESNV